MLFVWRGSVLPDIAPQLLLTSAFAGLVTVLHGQVYHWQVSLNFVPFSLIGLTLAIFLGFCNSTSDSPYWVARPLWGPLLTHTRPHAPRPPTLGHEQPPSPRLPPRPVPVPPRPPPHPPTTCRRSRAERQTRNRSPFGSMKHDGPTLTCTFAPASGDTAHSVSPWRARPPDTSASAIHASTCGLKHHDVTCPSIGLGNA